ncbi:WD40-repeat-containing domain protein [Dunaliella salina]|uniref:WD40-repeat-containing domain protein n=1 Tax=Dunaliella salina TaxID=3046 RepID=A0ABQ7GVQ7_DUNSA|nr:WD40-repeat-containing domain protein [Dunaliella salina]|eukprot:KAF5838694.1 WD40-repeat-containing domain protein [Dunaliella salina]
MDYIDPGRIEIGSELGHGAFGSVFTGRLRVPTADGKTRWQMVAIKQLSSSRSPTSSVVERAPLGAAPSEQFMREIMSTIQTSREVPNVVQTYGWSTLQHTGLCLVMKLYKGSLHKRIDEEAGDLFPIRTILRFGVCVLRGLAGLHAKRIVFDDLKPANVLLEEDDNAVLADFGLSRPMGKESLVSTKTLAGTYFYMPPEKLRHSPGEKLHFTYAADMWAFGITFIQLLQSDLSAPYGHGVTIPNIVMMLMVDKEMPKVPATPELPLLQSLVQPCLQLDPAARPTAAALLKEFEGLLEGLDNAPGSTNASIKEMQDLQGKMAALGLKERSLKAIEAELKSQEAELKSQEARLRQREEGVAARENQEQKQQQQQQQRIPYIYRPRVVRTPRASPQCVCTLAHGGSVWSLAFHPDDTRLFSGSTDHTIKMWDVPSGKCLATLTGHTGMVLSVAVSPDGRTLASGSEDASIKFWDVETLRSRATLTGHSSRVNAVVITPDGKKCLSASRDRLIKVWDLGNAALKSSLVGHTDSIPCLAVSADGRWVLSGSWDKTVRQWDLSTCKEVRKMTGHTHNLQGVSFSPCGSKCVSSSSDRSIRVWSLLTGSCLLHLADAHSCFVRSLAVSPDGTLIVSASNDSKAGVWDLASGKNVAKASSPQLVDINFVTIDYGGTRFATGGGCGNARLWRFCD